MAAITRQWCRRLVNAYEVKTGVVSLQCNNCVIHSWALQRWASHNGALYKSVPFLLPFTYLRTLVKAKSFVYWINKIKKHIVRCSLLWLLHIKHFNWLYNSRKVVVCDLCVNTGNKMQAESCKTGTNLTWLYLVNKLSVMHFSRGNPPSCCTQQNLSFVVRPLSIVTLQCFNGI